jgi:FkbM family methyltransferase
MISYAQNFEDVMLERLFGDRDHGFYVDIGAWDPHLHSVTKHFYLKGWHGINVEPIVSRIQRFELDRPRDLNLNVAIASEKGDVSFWTCHEEDALSTTEESTADELRGRGFSFTETKVSARYLDDIFNECGLTDIDFLKIDVEGAEAEVIRTAAFERYRPRFSH